VRFGRDERVAVRDAVNEAAQRGLEGDALANAVRGTVSALPFIAAAYTFREAAGTNAQADSFAALFARSQSEGRVLDFSGRFGVHVRYPPHTLTSAERATHGSPYYYDRSVPLFFIGAGVRPGDSSVPVGTVDVAPTLAALGRIRTPADLDGRSLMSELLAPE